MNSPTELLSPLDRAMHYIESREFAVRVNVASDYSTFLEALWSNPVTAALAALAAQPEHQDRILRRIQDLAALEPDSRYENPHDAAMAAYLLVLSTRSPVTARIAAFAVEEAPRTWWAKRLAQSMLSPRRSVSEADTTIYEVSSGHQIPREASGRAQSDDRLILGSPVRGDLMRALLRAMSAGRAREDAPPIDVSPRQAGRPIYSARESAEGDLQSVA